MLALYWRCDGSDGIIWRLRGIDSGGAFYGEAYYNSDNDSNQVAFVSGRLAPAEAEQMAELVAIVRRAPPAPPGPCFATLFERPPTTLAGARVLYEYRLGDEARSEAARAFVELASLIERHLDPQYARSAEPSAAPDRC
ncbi:MAG TPA: hypothetical protein VGE74_26350 [Gemmata sp.]